MRCSHCNISIGCRTPVCPLCHAPFSRENGSLATAIRLPRAFPARSKSPLFGTLLFDKIYAIVALNITLIAFAAELIILGYPKISWVVVAGLFYLYFLIRSTLQDTKYFSQKVLGQAIFLSVLAIALQEVISAPFFIYEYILPSIYMVSMVMIAIYILIRLKSPRKYLFHLISVALLAFLPFAVVLAERADGHSANYIMAVVTAVFGAVIILTTVSLSAQRIVSEIKRIFHI
ncbi:MAG: DUF6320 domain-containing protein [Clostridia bacterium]